MPLAYRLRVSLATLVLLLPALLAPAAAPTVAATAVTTPAASSPCGNGLLDDGETCEQCPADCRPAACKSDKRYKVTIHLTPQKGFEKVGAVTVLLGYRQGVLTLPGKKNEPAVAARVAARNQGAQVFANDLGSALRVVVSSNDGLPAGPLVDVELDGCAGAATPTAADLSCRVEACAKGGGRLRHCSCQATLP